jgi:hypothetical protein
VFSNLSDSPQIDDSGHRISRDPSGKMQESHWTLQENTGDHWNMEVYWIIMINITHQ